MNAPIIHGGGITAAAALYGGKPEDWLDLSTGISPFPAVLPDIPMRAWHRLPDQHLVHEAREAARDYYGSGDSLPLPVPGTQSVIQLLPRLIAAGGRVAILGPTYGEYERAFVIAEAEVDRLDGIEEVGDHHVLVVIVNPNNPDGRIYRPATLLDLARRLAARGGLLVVDEAFGDTVPDASVAGHVVDHANLIVFRSFGKFFGLAGLRLGFVIAAREILDRFESLLGPWAVSGPALSIAASLLRTDTEPLRRAIAQRSEAMRGVLTKGGLRIRGGTALFSLVEDAAADALQAHLCVHHILVRKFGYAPSWLRFGVTADTTGDLRLADALMSFNR
ncbi:threonine-phosphate decarboxylase CobD [Rhizobium sp. Rhizsp42]|uniref:threonine-phosphate decarboxylase CobD n=1 Tax=Rhizobium sp. Rhizsp42 TaxID=3243034 RepID=UPI0039B0C313